MSSRMKRGYQDNFKPVYFFFLRKDFGRTKNTKRKTNSIHPLRSFCAHEKLLPLLISVCLILFCWLMFACECFCMHEIFS